MVTMVVFVIAMVAAAQILSGLIGQFKQQSRVAESNVEGLVGLEMLRGDLEVAGSGLPWVMGDAAMGFADYDEAVNDATTDWDDTAYNDSPGNPPRAVVIDEPATGFQTDPVNTPSDVLVIKAANITLNQAVRKWTYISNNGGLPNIFRTWGNAEEDLAATDRIIVINPERGSNRGILLNNAGVFFTKVEDLPANGGAASTVFEPTTNSYGSFLVYGISEGADPRMPFNRADFYVRRPANLPSRCEPSTGVLYKATITNTTDATDGGKHVELPLLDCVGYMKAVVALDVSNDGNLTILAPPTGSTADVLRTQLKQIRVYIVAQEGQRDPTYQSPATIAVPDVDDFTVPDRNYRWKLYTLVVTPTSLR